VKQAGPGELPRLELVWGDGAYARTFAHWLHCAPAAPLAGVAGELARAVRRRIGLVMELPPLAASSLFACPMGEVALNVLKEELLEDRESRFRAFAAGTAASAALRIVTR
jgi:hypothetical protein